MFPRFSTIRLSINQTQIFTMFYCELLALSCFISLLALVTQVAHEYCHNNRRMDTPPDRLAKAFDSTVCFQYVSSEAGAIPSCAQMPRGINVYILSVNRIFPVGHDSSHQYRVTRNKNKVNSN